MGLLSIVTLWKKQQVSRACQLISSRDPAVRYAATKLTGKEEEDIRAKFRPMVVAREALTVDPGMGRKKLSQIAKNMVAEDDNNTTFFTVMSSERQTGALHHVEEEAAAEWAAALECLSPSELKFTLNACQDTLPHNSNLALWKGHPSECKLRPDIVIWSDTTRSVSLFELTVCHESNFVDACHRMTIRYLDLEQDIRHAHFRVKTYPIQVGCRGFIDPKSFEGIKEHARSIRTKTWKEFFKETSLTTIKASYSIWTNRNCKN